MKHEFVFSRTRPLKARLRQNFGGQPSFPPACQPKLRRSEGWWSQTGSNRRPPACKAGALPAELWPQKSGSVGSPTEARGKRPGFAFQATPGNLLSLRERRLVGLGRLELPTSRLSSARSNQLSYKP